MPKYIHSIYEIINLYHAIVYICNVHQNFISFSTNSEGPGSFLQHPVDTPDTIYDGKQASVLKAITRPHHPADARVKLSFSLSLVSYLCIILGWNIYNGLPIADPPRNTSDGWTVRVESLAHSIKRG